jgi:methionine-rich copper-binding protein CopC
MFKSLLAAAAIVALGSGQACAHARLIRAQPRVGTTVPQSPVELRLSFSEAIDLAHSTVALRGPGGAPVALGTLRLERSDARVVVAPVLGTLAPATYRVEWSMTSADTHQTDGDFRFTVKP